MVAAGKVEVAQEAAVALGGLVLLGAALGLPGGAMKLVVSAGMLPLVVACTAVMMFPALYIGWAVLGSAPPAQVLAAHGANALRVMGTVACGLSPAVLFLVASASQPATVVAVGEAALLLGAMLALRALFTSLFPDEAPGRSIALFGAWAVVCLGMGQQLMSQVLGG